MIQTYHQQSESMLNECSTTAEKRDDEDKDGKCNQNINANVVRVNVENLNPVLEARIYSNPDCERK